MTSPHSNLNARSHKGCRTLGKLNQIINSRTSVTLVHKNVLRQLGVTHDNEWTEANPKPKDLSVFIKPVPTNGHRGSKRQRRENRRVTRLESGFLVSLARAGTMLGTWAGTSMKCKHKAGDSLKTKAINRLA